MATVMPTYAQIPSFVVSVMAFILLFGILPHGLWQCVSFPEKNSSMGFGAPLAIPLYRGLYFLLAGLTMLGSVQVWLEPTYRLGKPRVLVS